MRFICDSMKNLIKAEKAIDILVFFYYLSW